MAYITREALLGASDIVERDVELPSIGATVKVQSLPALYSSEAISEALEFTTDSKGHQVTTINSAKLEMLQVLHGLVEPRLGSIEDVRAFAAKTGPAFKKIVETINEISDVNEGALEKAEAAFQGGGAGTNGKDVGASAAVGDSGPAVHVRAGVGDADAAR